MFSSKRRHTRCLSDWSSDVCSSDLLEPQALLARQDRSFPSECLGVRRLGRIFLGRRREQAVQREAQTRRHQHLLTLDRKSVVYGKNGDIGVVRAGAIQRHVLTEDYW